MSHEEKTGGPAFPVPPTVWDSGNENFASAESKGMTLLDYFAAKSIPVAIGIFKIGNAEAIARTCYAVARAMIAERKKIMEGGDNG